MGFPGNFLWGAASASYQIEGAAFEDGKGLSIWDMFCRKNKAIENGDTGDVACDHYHRYKEDVALMKEVGIKAYRFSLSWPRIVPDGAGAINAKGIDFYSKLIDALLEAGIEPCITLYHWDMPCALYMKGGWLNRDSARWFSAYANSAAEAFSDRVTKWITFNEPNVFVGLGYITGEHAPGLKVGEFEKMHLVHHVLRAHVQAYTAINAAARQKCTIGIAPAAQIAIPATDSQEDIEAARAANFPKDDATEWDVNVWLDPLVKGVYPFTADSIIASQMPETYKEDCQTMKNTLDFTGLNIYFGQKASAGKPDIPVCHPGMPTTAFNWPVAPECLFWIPLMVNQRYNLPLYITENGISCRDWISLDGAVHDVSRIDYTARCLAELRRACERGADVRGYFHWSIMDNFEWAKGFRERFGLIYVDYETQKRTLKDSAYWYRDCIAANGGNLPERGTFSDKTT